LSVEILSWLKNEISKKKDYQMGLDCRSGFSGLKHGYLSSISFILKDFRTIFNPAEKFCGVNP